jgi:hypothetical protein
VMRRIGLARAPDCGTCPRTLHAEPDLVRDRGALTYEPLIRPSRSPSTVWPADGT